MSVNQSQSSAVKKPKMLVLGGPHEYIEKIRRVGILEPGWNLFKYHFDVTMVMGDQDYADVVEQHEPDIVLFDGGCDSFKGRYPTYINTDAHPDVPKVGFSRNDFHSPMRLNSCGRFEQWGVDAFFNDSWPLKGAPKAFAERTFFIPRWVNDELFHDYGESKCIPVSMLGAGFLSSNFYPWRRRVAPKIIENFPFFHAPRPMPRPHMIVGDAYARMINRSYFVVGCGGASRSLVSKLFEIPGARSILVTESTEVVRDAGFVDGENCLLVDEHDVVDRIQYLLDHPEELEALTERSYQFIHSRHTFRQRTQLREWLDLHKQLKPGQRIIQTSMAKPLQIVGENDVQTEFVPFESTEIRVNLDRGFEALEARKHDQAISVFESMVNTYHYMFEPQLGLGIAHLAKGNMTKAVVRFARNLNFQNGCHSRVEDPVNQAYFALCFLCADDLPSAIKFAAREPHVRHPLLNAVRWLVALKQPSVKQYEPFTDAGQNNLMTLNSLDPRQARSFQDWLLHCVEILAGCKQMQLIQAIQDSGIFQAPAASASK